MRREHVQSLTAYKVRAIESKRRYLTDAALFRRRILDRKARQGKPRDREPRKGFPA